MLASAAPCPLTNTSRASTCGRNSFLLIQVITIQHLLYYHHNFRYLIPKLIHFITRKFQKFSIKDIILIITSHTLPLHRYTYVVFYLEGTVYVYCVLCRCGLQSNMLRFSGAALWSLSIVFIIYTLNSYEMKFTYHNTYLCRHWIIIFIMFMSGQLCFEQIYFM